MRKGFSLVEIMVVVVILGVLAGVGVPKLFGVIAKARASEVPVAAGTYVSLQNAYLHENNGIGSWKNIGYGAPGNGQTEYFDYSGCINGTIVFDQMEPDMPGWQATSRAGLNSCVTGSAWAVVIDPAGEREIDYRKIISSPECAMLTSTWGEVGETVEGMCETTGELHVAGTENKTPEKPETPTETPTEDPSDPGTPPQEQNQTNTENPEPQQGDCNALAESMKGKGADKGNKYGWVCVSACGVFAPPGKARNAGFDTGPLQKKKDTGGSCEKVEPENSTGGNAGSSAGSSATQGSASSSASTVPGSSANETQTNGGSGSTGGTGVISGTPVGQGGVTGFVGLGDYHEFDADNDYCDGDIVDGNCNGNYRPNSECKKWSEKNCNNNGKGSVQNRNKNNCGTCTDWNKK
ncbi:prepilin-type N-terminal cleavage/methylation domain-containing protein [Fibrobacter sp.]|uniref:pilin n=1 Tax=Fibrobacter sp. TaxID=35828 RepID=UPI0025BA44DC|nr:prepilin-type N-terminal cleavage/methylation domain-containing protein [Fibrobacter sp.]MBR2059423.1 prepilin-type N-terminal cleavage/methylation domain-containing protein [Fibrobacter sp.]MBR2308698.1 prepilin-type N-terminal cleavage/methylation domain-containing protein [Fibrobacter sp.]MBR4007865.1 prepilin-type N-terminal cleavage/methylation domain-containing protein [Fibrobacter sp.]